MKTVDPALTPNLQRWVNEAVRRQLEARLHEIFERAAEELYARVRRFSAPPAATVDDRDSAWTEEMPQLVDDLKSLGYAVAESFEHMAGAVGTVSPETHESAPIAPEAGLPSTLPELRESSLSTAEAAARLGVNPSRIRQRLLARTLFGFKDGASWWVPGFQFEGDRVVPGVDQVFPEIRPSVSPVAVARWFVIPWEDLVVDEERETVVSPRTWLLEGRDPAPVVAQARVL